MDFFLLCFSPGCIGGGGGGQMSLSEISTGDKPPRVKISTVGEEVQTSAPEISS